MRVGTGVVMRRKNYALISILLGGIGLLMCCARSPNPVEKMIRDLSYAPEFSIILDDMREEGNFFKSYYHRYRIIQGETARVTDWKKVPKEFYQRNMEYLGMTLAAKPKGGSLNTTAAPPGYNYVGNAQYGTWRTDRQGSSFWEFYGKYRLFTDLLSFGGRISRSDYGNYTDYSRRGRPYYGPRNDYGTNGTFTQKTKPSFFQRRKLAMQQKRSSFANRVRNRTGRSRTGYRSRGSGFGK
jgi:hypothetical protein